MRCSRQARRKKIRFRVFFIYDIDGNPVDTLVAEGSSRETASGEELTDDLINAFVAMEDAGFWDYHGIGLRSIGRAAYGLLSRNYAGGGSTITQSPSRNKRSCGPFQIR